VTRGHTGAPHPLTYLGATITPPRLYGVHWCVLGMFQLHPPQAGSQKSPRASLSQRRLKVVTHDKRYSRATLTLAFKGYKPSFFERTQRPGFRVGLDTPFLQHQVGNIGAS
jgi:hypothetical protein